MPPSEAPGAPSWLQARDGVADLLFSVVPNARRTELAGLHDGCLRLKLGAPAVDGKANEALINWLAKALTLPRHRLALVAGAHARRKRVRVQAPASQVAAQVSAWLGADGREPDPPG